MVCRVGTDFTTMTPTVSQSSGFKEAARYPTTHSPYNRVTQPGVNCARPRKPAVKETEAHTWEATSPKGCGGLTTGLKPARRSPVAQHLRQVSRVTGAGVCSWAARERSTEDNTADRRDEKRSRLHAGAPRQTGPRARTAERRGTGSGGGRKWAAVALFLLSDRAPLSSIATCTWRSCVHTQASQPGRGRGRNEYSHFLDLEE